MSTGEKDTFGTVSLIQPAVRMVVIEVEYSGASAGNESVSVEVYPVLALSACRVTQVIQPWDLVATPPFSLDDAQVEKCRRGEEYLMYDLVINHPACGVVGFEFLNGFLASVLRAVSCTWPLEMDEQQLQPIIDQMIEVARELDESRRKAVAALKAKSRYRPEESHQ